MKGVLDRFEGDQAVILMEEENSELILKKIELPEGSKINTVFNIKKQDEHYQIVGIDDEAEQEAKETTSDLMAKLRAKSNGSRFKKN